MKLRLDQASGHEPRPAGSARRLRLHYQPIYDIRRSVISHLEALVCCQQPQSGLMPRGEAIPIAEAGGITLPAGARVLPQVLEDLEILDRAGHGDIRIAVKLSAGHLGLASFVRGIDAIGGSHPGRNRRIALEIAAQGATGDGCRMNAGLDALRASGLQIYLDGIGTGDASFGRLRRFGFDGVKIARGLIADLEDNASSLANLRSIVLVADSLGMTTIAEGVESQACLDIVRKQGCRHAQGNGLCTPLPIEDIRDVVREHAATARLADALRVA